ncbi:MAG: hypothetical protein R2762_10540 [Bryobacteraceae bacterium]
MSLRSRLRRFLFLLALSAPVLAQTGFRIETILGDPFSPSATQPDGIPATAARFTSINGVAVDAAGLIYIADTASHRVRRVNRDGSITTIAGTGAPGYSGDGGPATRAALDSPYGLAVDAAGSVFIADYGNACIRRVDPSGVIRTVASTARFTGPRNIAAASSGDLYVSDFAGHAVYRIFPNGSTSVIAGAASSIPVRAPAGVATDGLGAVYVADSGNRRVLRIAGGASTTILDAQSPDLALGTPLSLSLDAFGTLLIADTLSGRVIERAPNGAFAVWPASGAGLSAVTEVALSPRGAAYVSDRTRLVRIVPDSPPEAIAGAENDAAVLSAPLDAPIGLTLDKTGNLFIAEEASRRIRKLAPDGDVSTAATGSLLEDPVAIAHDPAFGLRIADYQSNRILGVSSAGDLYAVSGDGQPGTSSEGDFAVAARWNKPRALVFDSAGNLFIADSLNHRVRRIGLDGRVTTVAGTGAPGFSPAGGRGTGSALNTPTALAAGPQDTIYIADAGNHAVFALSRTGDLTRIAGSGLAGDSGDAGPATQARLRFPAGLAVAPDGVLYIADTYNHRIRRVLPTGIIETIAGDGVAGLSGDGGPAQSARLHTPTALALDSAGNLYVADLENNRIRRLFLPSPQIEPAQPQSSAPPPAVTSQLLLRNAASLAAGPISPGERLAVSADPASELLIDGRAAPRLATGDGIIEVQAPYALTPGSTASLELWLANRLVAKRSLPVAPSSPGLYTAAHGNAVLIHDDGSRNSVDKPAARGAVVSVFLTGAGRLSPLPPDGAPARDPLPEPVLPVSVLIGGAPVDVLWAGAAPGLIGIIQVNFRLPGLFTPPGARSIRVNIGGIESQDEVTVHLR